jgi:Sulfatase
MLAFAALRASTVTAQSVPPPPPHVVILIMDEFPGDHMLRADGFVDGVRFPAMARLARRSHWFPNASTWSAATSTAVPAILDGRLPRAGTPPTSRGHPFSLYHVLGGAGYRIVDSEETTTLCPRHLCARLAVRSPPCRVRNCRFMGSGRVRRFERWLATIRRARAPTLWVKHLLLPHRPWIYLPSGLRTQAGGRIRGPLYGLNRFGGPPDEFLRLHNYQRHLLQLRFTDRLVGRLLDRLVRQRMFDRSLVVVTSDHGYSFTGGLEEHRRLHQANVHQIAPVPLLVKLPGQRAGQRHDTYAATLDVMPTVADAVGVELAAPTDGAPLLGETVRSRGSVFLADRVGLPLGEFEQRRAAWNERRLRLFGSGRRGFWDGIGPNRHLVGRRVRQAWRRAGRMRAEFVNAHRLRRVRRASGVLPIEVAGHLRGGARRRRYPLALAVNGRIEAVGRSFRLPRDRVMHFAMLIRPSSLHEGRNRVELFRVRGGTRLRLLGRL